MMKVIAPGGRDLDHLADQRGDQAGLLGDADADHRDQDDRDDAEVVEVLDGRGEDVADPVGAEQALDLDRLGDDLVVGDRLLGLVVERRVRRAAVVLLGDRRGHLGSATSVVTLTSAQDRTADSTITPTIRPRKMIAGCGTLLPTRSIQPRKPSGPVSSSSAAAAALIGAGSLRGLEAGGQLDRGASPRTRSRPCCARSAPPAAGPCRRCRRAPTGCRRRTPRGTARP